MSNRERIERFADFLGLSVLELQKIAARYGLPSRSTFLRIRRGKHNESDQRRGIPGMVKLARLVSPEFLAALPADERFLEPELAAKLLGVGNTAWFGWERFLTGETSVPPKMRWLEEDLATNWKPEAAERATQLQKLRGLVDKLESEALGVGAIRGGRSAGELLRWAWSNVPANAELWLRMRLAFCLVQSRLEETAAVVYLAAPVLPLLLLPRRVWQPRIGDGIHLDAAAEIQLQCSARRNPLRRLSEKAVVASDTPARSAAAVAATGVLQAYSRRFQLLQAGIGLRQAVVVLFSEEKTRAFFEKVGLRGRLESARALAALERRGLVLLASPMTAEDEQELPACVTVGGDTPGIAMVDEMVEPGGRERAAWVAFADSVAYQQGRACIDKLANHPQTKRVRAADVNALILPASVAAALKKRAQKKFNFEPWHYHDL